METSLDPEQPTTSKKLINNYSNILLKQCTNRGKHNFQQITLSVNGFNNKKELCRLP